MPEFVLAIDAGTTSIRAMIVDAAGQVRAQFKESCPLDYPKPGLVEQDPERIWQTTLGVIRRAIDYAGLAPSELGAIGITAQRSCCVVWDRATGIPAAPLVSWQDLRGMQRALEFNAMGIPVQPQSAAAKLEMVIDAIPRGRERVARGELAWGNVDSYLIARLTGGRSHVTDPSHACTTAFFDYESGAWSHPMLELQRWPLSFFPQLVDTAGITAVTSAQVFGAEIPIAAIVGDQQSAAIAHRCNSRGAGKVTYGTSATANVNTGAEIVHAPGMYPLVLKSINGVTTYCLEGMVITAGAVFDWLANGLGIMASPADAESLAMTCNDSGGVLLLPALQGLGTPHFDFARTAEIRGLTRGTSAGQLVLAAMEGVSFRVRGMLEAMDAVSGVLQFPWFPVDGGPTVDDVFMQVQANVLGKAIRPRSPMEASVYGAASLAGSTLAGWAVDSWQDSGRREFIPQWSEDERNGKFAAWKKAFGLTGPV